MNTKRLAIWLIVVITLSLSATATVQAAKNRPIEGCSLFDIGCQVDSVIEAASSAVSAASDWATDWARDAADSARETASGASQRASDWARDAANVAGRSARRAFDSAESYVRDAYDLTDSASRRAVDQVYSSGSKLLRETYENGNEFMQGVYAGGPQFLQSLDLDREVAIAMLFLPGVHPAASWGVARIVTYELLRYYGYEVGSDPVIDAAINLAIDYVLSTPPGLVWQIAPEVTQLLIGEFGGSIGRRDIVQEAISLAIRAVGTGAIFEDFADCSLKPVLRIGELAVLGSETPSRVRSAPNVNADHIGNINGFERVFIAGGPVCSNGYFWYYVIAENVDGWTVQGANGRYWLDPLHEIASFVDNSLSRATTTRSGHFSACPLPPRLTVGARAIVNPGLPNNVRSGPALRNRRVGRIIAGEALDVLSGPVCADGYNWYEVRSRYVYGWTAEAGDGEYWVVKNR